MFILHKGENTMNPLLSIKGTLAIGFIAAIATIFIFDIKSLLTLTVWLHVFAGIIWIGLLYYFNFIQMPAIAATIADPDNTPAAINKHIAPNALLWFRMAAAVTWILGLSALESVGVGIVPAFTFANGAEIIGLGSWLGTIMAANVWFIIWPNQKIALGMVSGTEETVAKAKKIAMLASRINVALSIPMLLTMIAHRF